MNLLLQNKYTIGSVSLETGLMQLLFSILIVFYKCLIFHTIPAFLAL